MDHYDRINPYKPLTLDCKDWARAKHAALSDRGLWSVRFLHVRPSSGFGTVGRYRLPEARWPGGQWAPFEGKGDWFHHFAVVLDHDFVVDELYPDGMPLSQYMELFENKDGLTFDIVKQCVE